MKLSENPDIPVLEGWVNLTEAGEITGVTRQHAYRKAAKGGYKTLRRIGTQPVFVVKISELEEINAKKAQRAEAKKVREQPAEESAE
jgi:hypothetical protein